MADKTPIERKAKKVEARDWTDVRAAWLEHIPTGGYPQDAETTEVPDLPGLRQDAEPIEDKDVALLPMLDGLPSLVLAEALTLLHKATHVLGGAQVHVTTGMCSWSTASGYQAALFGAHALLRLLRVCTVQFASSHFLLDLWPAPPSRRATRGEHFLVIRLPGPRLEHRPVWILLQRMLRVATVDTDLWPSELVAELRDLPYEDFARQRNALHYKLSAWPLSDLRQCQSLELFGAVTPLQDGCLSPDLDDFSVRLGVALQRLASALLLDLAAQAPGLTADATSVKDWVAGAHYTVYRASAV